MKLLPLRSNVPPSGPLAVGRVVHGSEVLSRSASHAQTVEAQPSRVVQLWYPCDTARLPVSPEPPTFWRRCVNRLVTRGCDSSRVGAPIAPGARRFPLLLYSPSWSGTAVDNRALICDLVSHGFIVATLTYPFGSSPLPATDFERMVTELGSPMSFCSEDAYRHTVADATHRVRSRARDAVALLDGLTLMNEERSGMLAQRLDLDKVGIFGFSLGGAVAAEAATLDPRFRAAANMDGRHWGTALERGVAQPYLFIGSELHDPSPADFASPHQEQRYNALLDRHDYAQLAANLRRNGGVHVTFLRSDHGDFADSSLRARLRSLRHLRKIPALRSARMVHDYLIQFFQQAFLGERSTLLANDARPHRKVSIQSWQSTAGNRSRETSQSCI